MILKQTETKIPTNLAFRICALRETYEECGIFLRKSNNSTKISQSDLAEHRELVYEDPKHFVNFCKEYRVCPDVWSLFDYNCWLTPVATKETRRFDTMFYTTFLEEPFDSVSIDKEDRSGEVTSLQWSCPEQVRMDKESFLAPPQIYELSQFSKFESMNKLIESCARRQEEGFFW